MFHRKYVKQQLYLYLVDEHSGLPVFDPTKLYPIKIDVNDTNLSKSKIRILDIKRGIGFIDPVGQKIFSTNSSTIESLLSVKTSTEKNRKTSSKSLLTKSLLTESDSPRPSFY